MLHLFNILIHTAGGGYFAIVFIGYKKKTYGTKLPR